MEEKEKTSNFIADDILNQLNAQGIEVVEIGLANQDLPIIANRRKYPTLPTLPTPVELF
ncbi:MAG: hypothetical protein II864_00890 [Prevotella sp.]|nr:hypothetical protein [Prevotella sp.]